MEIKEMLLTPNKYSRPQTALKSVTKLAIHYVGNPGSTAVANRNYFENLKNTKTTSASSHYIIGLDGEIIRCVPENEVAYCTNAANSYSISIENCHPKSDGKFNDKTYSSLIELCADICKRYKLDPLSDIIRHYDVTGKSCPLYYVNNQAEWDKLKQAVKKAMESTPKLQPEEQSSPVISAVNDAIKQLNSIGIISTPDYWYKATDYVKYLDTLLINAANICGADVKNNLTSFESTLQKLVSGKVINSPDYWRTAATVVNWLDALIINMGNRIS